MATKLDIDNSHLYGCDEVRCRVTMFITKDTRLARCPGCNTMGRHIRRPNTTRKGVHERGPVV